MIALNKNPDIRWEQIKVFLLIRGYSLADLAKLYGKNPVCFRCVKKRPYPKIEKIIASYLDLNPWDLWPERYDSNGKPNRVNKWYQRGSTK
jgi:Ner family transcriptional regulator